MSAAAANSVSPNKKVVLAQPCRRPRTGCPAGVGGARPTPFPPDWATARRDVEVMPGLPLRQDSRVFSI